MIKLYQIYLFVLIVSACTEQRDLFVVSSPLLMIENDFKPAQISNENGATAMIYDRPKGPTELVPNAMRKTIGLAPGFYDIMIFNGLMYSPTQSHLDHIYYRGTDGFDTFEAVATEMSEDMKFRAKSNEKIIHFPDILATRSTAEHKMQGRQKFEMKYANGKNGLPTSPNYIEDTLYFSPCRVTHTCQVIARVRNPKSARIVQAKLHGFSGSVFLANRMPGHNYITHQFTLNSLKIDQSDPNIGTITSPVFNTFGPPLDLPDRRYTIEVNVLMTNSQELPTMAFDVTDQVNKAITYLTAERLKNKPIMDTFYIFIEFELPNVVSDNMDVGVEDWGNDVIITVPIKFDN